MTTPDEECRKAFEQWWISCEAPDSNTTSKFEIAKAAWLARVPVWNVVISEQQSTEFDVWLANNYPELLSEYYAEALKMARAAFAAGKQCGYDDGFISGSHKTPTYKENKELRDQIEVLEAQLAATTGSTTQTYGKR